MPSKPSPRSRPRAAPSRSCRTSSSTSPADGVTLTATDLEIGIRHAVAGVDVQAPGSIVLSVTRFGCILRESTDQTLHIESDGQGTTIRGERSKFQLPAENPAEFPPVADFTEASFFEIPARLLRELIRRTVFATDNESSRYALGGVKLEFDGGQVTAIGTDGRRLAKMAGPIGVHGAADRAAAEHDRPHARHAAHRAGHRPQRRRAADGHPRQRVPRPQPAGDDLGPPARRPLPRLAQGVPRRAAPASRSSSPPAPRTPPSARPPSSPARKAAASTSPSATARWCSPASAAEVGQSRVELPIGYDGREITITLDPRFVIDFLKVLDADKTFTLELKDSDSAAMCTTDDGYGYVIMPLARDR